MKPPLNPSFMFFLLVPFFISINIPTSLGADDYRFTNCTSSSFSCGRVSNLKYPFWGENRAEYCGLPDFELKCEGSIPKIIIQSIKYQILHLNLTSQILTVARDDYFETICPLDYKNNTFDSTTFKYVDGLVDVTFLYDCATPLSQPNFYGQDCEREDGTQTKVYYVLELVYIFKCKSVIIPLSQTALAEAAPIYKIQAALDDGFGLQWIVDNKQCDTCTKSGGECGYKGQFSCFCKEGPQKTSCSQGSPESTKKLGLRPKIAIGISASVVSIVVFAVILNLFIRNQKMPLRMEKRKIFEKTNVYHHHSVETFMKDYGSLSLRQYSYSEVKRMTKSFSDKLGQGGYGVVYKASLLDGHLVAVKVIIESKGSGEEFINEVASISRTSHVNIVTLVGFCYEGSKRALIYEYMPNGSLDNYIHKEGSPNAFCALEWRVLCQISIGIARGLDYLHRGCNTRILHLDIKPQNILLDEDFCPKISDFGLAKICRKKESIVSIMGTRGTIGFIAPEVLSRAFGGVSHKSDVYSYGMLVLEMIGGRKNYDSGGSHANEMYFPDWIYKDLERGNISTSSLSITKYENELVRKMTLVSLWCIQTNPSDRPSMSKVVEMLEGPLQSISFPPKPSLQSPTRSPLQFSNGSSSEILETNSIST